MFSVNFSKDDQGFSLFISSSSFFNSGENQNMKGSSATRKTSNRNSQV